VTIRNAYAITTTTNAVTASKTSITSRQWGACVATFKGDLASTTAGAEHASVGAHEAGVGIPGPVTAAGAEHASIGTHEDGTSLPGVRVVGGAEHESEGAHEAGTPAIADYDPDHVTTLAAYPDGMNRASPLKASGSGYEHGDRTDCVSLRKSGNYTGTMALACDGIAEDSISGAGDIAGVTLHCDCRIVYDGSVPSMSNAHFTLPGRTAAMLTDPPKGASGVDFATVSSAMLTTTDGTTLWTWANIYAALRGLTASVDVSFMGTTIQADVALFSVDVHGPIGTKHQELAVDVVIAPIRMRLQSRLAL
jgi:hypothetical protein